MQSITFQTSFGSFDTKLPILWLIFLLSLSKIQSRDVTVVRKNFIFTTTYTCGQIDGLVVKDAGFYPVDAEFNSRLQNE